MHAKVPAGPCMEEGSGSLLTWGCRAVNLLGSARALGHRELSVGSCVGVRLCCWRWSHLETSNDCLHTVGHCGRCRAGRDRWTLAAPPL